MKEFKDYREARRYAQEQADKFGCDYGLEFNKLFRFYTVRVLPQVCNRYGYDATCEVVISGKLKPGHGAEAS